MVRRVVFSVCLVVAAGLVAVGVFLVAVPAGFVVAGVMLLAVAYVLCADTAASSAADGGGDG